jgi:sterol desaturase/sphingolipid hydroxylase (fatty acid hydroxylase superfamily)
VALYLIVADLGHYWIHRLMHSAFFWRIHKWHHSPAHMSWAAGVRATFFRCHDSESGLCVRVAPAGHDFVSVPMRGQLLLLMFVVLKNDWMHNVRCRLPTLPGRCQSGQIGSIVRIRLNEG